MNIEVMALFGVGYSLFDISQYGIFLVPIPRLAQASACALDDNFGPVN